MPEQKKGGRSEATKFNTLLRNPYDIVQLAELDLETLARLEQGGANNLRHIAVALIQRGEAQNAEEAINLLADKQAELKMSSRISKRQDRASLEAIDLIAEKVGAGWSFRDASDLSWCENETSMIERAHERGDMLTEGGYGHKIEELYAGYGSKIPKSTQEMLDRMKKNQPEVMRKAVAKLADEIDERLDQLEEGGPRDFVYIYEKAGDILLRLDVIIDRDQRDQSGELGGGIIEVRARHRDASEKWRGLYKKIDSGDTITREEIDEAIQGYRALAEDLRNMVK